MGAPNKKMIIFFEPAGKAPCGCIGFFSLYPFFTPSFFTVLSLSSEIVSFECLSAGAFVFLPGMFF
jgi:hypothetical protein